MPFKYTGFADEAGKSVAEQISATREAGWSSIEVRLVNGTNVCAMDHDAWSAVRDELGEADIEIAGFGSAIANWARTIDGDFKEDTDELRRCAPRMRDANCPIIRIMSYPNVTLGVYDFNTLCITSQGAIIFDGGVEVTTQIHSYVSPFLAKANSSGQLLEQRLMEGEYNQAWLKQRIICDDNDVMYLGVDIGELNIYEFTDTEAFWTHENPYTPIQYIIVYNNFNSGTSLNYFISENNIYLVQEISNNDLDFTLIMAYQRLSGVNQEIFGDLEVSAANNRYIHTIEAFGNDGLILVSGEDNDREWVMVCDEYLNF